MMESGLQSGSLQEQSISLNQYDGKRPIQVSRASVACCNKKIIITADTAMMNQGVKVAAEVLCD